MTHREEFEKALDEFADSFFDLRLSRFQSRIAVLRKYDEKPAAVAGLDVEIERVRDKLCDVLPLLGKKGSAGQARKEIEPLLLQLRKIANAAYIPARTA